MSINNYELFLPAITAITYDKVHENDQLSETEFRAIVAQVFRDSVIEVMRDTHAYQKDIPIDVYSGVTRYEIIAPDGFIVEDVIDILPHKYEPKDYTFNNYEVTLVDCCPNHDVSQAFFVKVALTPMYDTCEFDNQFLNKHYSMILELMTSKMLAMVNRKWKSLEQSRLHQIRYNNMMVKERNKIVMQDLSSATTSSGSNYKLFLPALAQALFKLDPRETAEQMNIVEFKRIVSTVFKNVMATVMEDTQLHRVDIPIDLYKGVDRYEIIPPKGYTVNDVGKFKEHKIRIPKHSHDLENIYLNCCPNKDVSEAFYVEVALTPNRASSVSNFDTDFINKYYDLILIKLKSELLSMNQRYWYDPGMSQMYKNDYVKMVNKVRRRANNGGSKIKLSVRRMSDYG